MVVINQVNKEWDLTTESMDKYCEAVRKLEGIFQGLEYIHVDRDRNVTLTSCPSWARHMPRYPPASSSKRFIVLLFS